MTARLQVLYLPSISDGDRHEPRYAFVVDRVADLPESDHEALRAFATSAGAQGCAVLSGALDVAQDDDEATEALQELLQKAVAEVPQPVPQQAPKLPPANTTEGKLARVLGGQKILEQMREGDPR